MSSTATKSPMWNYSVWPRIPIGSINADFKHKRNVKRVCRGDHKNKYDTVIFENSFIPPTKDFLFHHFFSTRKIVNGWWQTNFELIWFYHATGIATFAWRSGTWRGFPAIGTAATALYPALQGKAFTRVFSLKSWSSFFEHEIFRNFCEVCVWSMRWASQEKSRNFKKKLGRRIRFFFHL